MMPSKINGDFYTRDQLVRELDSLYDFCKENQLSDQDIRKIFDPVLTTLGRARLLKHLKICILTVFIIMILYVLCSTETVSWHLSAIGRILMIKALPLYDWTVLKEERCLITGSLGNLETTRSTDCVLCEAVSEIEKLEDYDNEYLYENYIKAQIPVILKQAVNQWIVFNMSIANITEKLMSNDILANSFPCKVSTNMNIGNSPLSKLFRNIHRWRSLFLHFQNCEYNPMKHFRTFTPRPDFLHPELAPVQYSWLLASRNYNVSKFKSLELQERITVVCQILGSTVLNLSPIVECEMDCYSMEVDLKMGEALVVTSIWNLEYKTCAQGECMSVILETH